MRFKVKTGFLGRLTLAYDCPGCKTDLSSPIDDAGKSDTCPDCGASFVVPGSEARDKIRAQQAAEEQERDEVRQKKREERQDARRQATQEVDQESLRETYAAMSSEQKSNYRMLTLIGLVFVTLPPLVMVVFGQSHRWFSVFVAMLFGATLLPQLWRWVDGRIAVVQQNTNLFRILAPVVALLLLVVVAPDWSYEESPVSPELADNQVLITREEYGEAWPFTVDEGILTGDSRGSISAVTFTVGDTTYGINGVALSDPSNARVEAIWAPNPRIPGTKINIGPIIDRGRSLAKGFDEPYIPRTPPPPEEEPVELNLPPIRCDKFVVNAEFVGGERPDLRKVQVSVDTDLPDETTVMIGIHRTWVNTAEGEIYSEEYFGEKSTVGQWRVPRTIDVRHSQFVDGLNKTQQSFAAINKPLSIDNIDDSIEVSFVVPMNQSDPRFDPQNKNLVGSAVEISYKTMRNVRGERKSRWPISSR